jgi:L-amino acid N-acyltransferase YncA
MQSEPKLMVRDALLEDIAAIAAIYSHHVRTGVGSFEEEPPSVEMMIERWRAIATRGLPWLVAEIDGVIVGYCYARPYHERSAYRFTLEDAVYVAPDAVRSGIGRALLSSVIDRCAAQGYRQMVAVIGDSANAGSIGLHAALGFRHVGTLRNVGLKFGRMLDCVLMQRELASDESAS